jgi:hypothetical protein
VSAQASHFMVAGISGEEILHLENLPAGPADAVYAAGSAVNGYGNPWSDIDIFVISCRSPIGPYAKKAETNETSQHYVNGRRLDFEYWRPEDVRRLAQRLDQIALGSGKAIQGTTFLYIEECFMHRLQTAVPVVGAENVEVFQRLFDFPKLGAYQAEDAIQRCDALLEDICGMMEIRDGDAALFTARELVGSAADAVLHHRGSTDPVRKWRCRHLAELGASDSRLVSDFWRLQFPDAAWMRGNWTELSAYLEQCIRFANRVIQQVQS